MCKPKAATTSEPKPRRGRSSEDTYRPNLQLVLGTLSFSICFAALGLTAHSLGVSRKVFTFWRARSGAHQAQTKNEDRSLAALRMTIGSN
jgi:hypothetical protein